MSAAHTIIGKRPLIGITDQAATPVEFTAIWINPSGGTVNAACSATLQSASLKHTADIKRLKDGKGARCTVTASDEAITLDVVAVPLGAAGSTSLADALKAATLPGALSFVTIANGPDIGCGPYVAGATANGGVGAINGDNWLYEGDGTVEIANESEWGLKFTLTRSPFLAKQNAVAL